MKRFLTILCCMLLCLAACSAPKTAELPEVLAEIDGESVLTREDFHFAQVYEGISETDREENRELFLRLAAESICTRIAEDYAENESRAEIEAEYEIYLESLETTGQKAYYDALRGELSELTEEEFRAAFLDFLYRTACTDALKKSIAAVYENTTDAQTIREGILENLWAIAEEMEITFYYPDTTQSDLNFEDIL